MTSNLPTTSTSLSTTPFSPPLTPDLPILYKLNAHGKSSFWRIYVVGDEYFRESGLVEDGAAVRKYPPVRCVGKNL